MDASTGSEPATELQWFERQAQHWLDMILQNNNPCYRPMFFALFSSGKDLGDTIMDKRIEDVAIPLVKAAMNMPDELELGDVRAVVYYFHVMKEDFDESNPVKRSTLHMHLFVPGQSTMVASSCWECTLYEGIKGDGSDDTVYMEPEEEPDNVNVPEQMKVLWESPFGEKA